MNKCAIMVIAWLNICAMTGCGLIDGLEQFKSGLQSPPAYPAYVANETVIWHEAGETWLIDKYGAHLLPPAKALPCP